jgi:hypothetical protein
MIALNSLERISQKLIFLMTTSIIGQILWSALADLLRKRGRFLFRVKFFGATVSRGIFREDPLS